MEFKGDKPIYLQIADLLCERILTGQYQADERIPSVREFSMELEVNPNTTVKSFTHLENMGAIHKRRGLGFFVSADARERIRTAHRDEFLGSRTREIARTLRLLGISVPEFVHAIELASKEE